MCKTTKSKITGILHIRVHRSVGAWCWMLDVVKNEAIASFFEVQSFPKENYEQKRFPFPLWGSICKEHYVMNWKLSYNVFVCRKETLIYKEEEEGEKRERDRNTLKSWKLCELKESIHSPSFHSFIIACLLLHTTIATTPLLILLLLATSDGSNHVWCSMSVRSKPEIGYSSSIIKKWMHSSPFDVRIIMFESVWWVIKA